MLKIPPDDPDIQDIFFSFAVTIWERYQASTIISASLTVTGTFSESLSLLSASLKSICKLTVLKSSSPSMKLVCFPFVRYTSTLGATGATFPFPDSWLI